MSGIYSTCGEYFILRITFISYFPYLIHLFTLPRRKRGASNIGRHTKSTPVKRQADNNKLETETTQEKGQRLQQDCDRKKIKREHEEDDERQNRLDAQRQRQAHLRQRETPQETVDRLDEQADRQAGLR